MTKASLEQRGAHSPPDPEQREAILALLRESLHQEAAVLFAYLHGSFLTDGPFRDLDLALYLEENSEALRSPFAYELDLEAHLEMRLRRAAGYPLPVDVRVLNHAPPAFCYRVIRSGAVLFVRDDGRRTDFETLTLSRYFDFAPFHKAYLAEVLRFGVR